MKKYLLNKYDLVLVRHIATKDDLEHHLFYIVDDKGTCVDVQENEEFYAFYDWGKFGQTKWSNVFSAKDCNLSKYVVKETNNWFRYRWWLLKYRHQNVLKYRR